MPSLSQIFDEMALAAAVTTDPTIPEDEREDIAGKVAAYLSDLTIQAEEKVDAIAAFKRRMESEIEFQKNEAARHQAKARAMENSLGRLRGYIHRAMEDHGFQKLAGRSSCISRKTTPGKLEIDFRDDLIPEDYRITTVVYQPDKAKIKAAIEANEPGVLSWARIVKGETLQIR